MPRTPATSRTAASDYLLRLARSLTSVYVDHTRPEAALLVGSAAEGVSDENSDVDLFFYYQTLPSEMHLDRARERLGIGIFSLLTPRSDRAVLETFTVEGVDCQIGHVTIAGFEEDVDTVLVKHDPDGWRQKLLEGLVHGIPLHGEMFLSSWQHRAGSFPPELGHAMIEHYLQIRPIWYVAGRMVGRDATLFLQQMRIDAVLNILGILAGLNRVYYSTFQFKRLSRFAQSLQIAPVDLASRLDEALGIDVVESASMLEDLARETLDLVSEHDLDIDLSRLRYPPGFRQQPWTQPALARFEDESVLES